METLTSCPICGCTQFEYNSTIKDHSITKETFTTVLCRECGFLFTNPRPGKDAISKYYESPEYISHSNSKKGLFNKAYQFIRNLSIGNKIALIDRLAGGDKTLLDIGCGTGQFLNACANKGWSVSGIEPNEKARNFALNEYHLSVTNEPSLKQFPAGSFKIITLWHVLEHVHDLKERVEDISRLLKTGGVAVIAVPNYKSFDAVHYKEYWAAYDVPRHLYHFSEITMKALFTRTDFEWKESIPMKYDSFYVSILSEKYRKTKVPFLNAFFIGLTSNLKAGANAEKYSSVIYVFRKK